MKDIFRSLVVIVVGATATAACMTAPDDEPAQLAEPTQLSEQASSSTSGRLITQSDIDKSQGSISIEADCSFVEWCNRPASISPDIGTVCRLRPGCAFNDTTVNECITETNNVCGAPVQPWWFCPQGGPAPCP